MSKPRIYTGAEALALLAASDDAPPSLLPWGLETDGDDWIIVAPESASEIARLPRLEGAETDARHIVDAVNDRRNLAASVAHHEARSTGLESLLLTFAADALAAIGRSPLPADAHPVEAARYAASQVRLFADDVTTARDNHFARAQRAEADRDRWRDALRRCAARCESSVATGPDDVDGMTREVLDELAIVDESYGSAQRVAESAWEALGLGDGMPRVAVGEDAVCEAIEARGAALIADRDAAIAHAAELEAALRVVRSTVEREADVALRPKRERNALRAIIEGRTVPPTDAEVYAHGGPGRSGWWLVSSPDDMSLELIEQPKERDWCIEWGATQWLPIGLDGRPCAWPVVPEAPGVR